MIKIGRYQILIEQCVSTHDAGIRVKDKVIYLSRWLMSFDQSIRLQKLVTHTVQNRSSMNFWKLMKRGHSIHKFLLQKKLSHFRAILTLNAFLELERKINLNWFFPNHFSSHGKSIKLPKNFIENSKIFNYYLQN